jgi:TadE-like protein
MRSVFAALRRRSTNEVGAAMVELAIILPVLMMLVFGIIEYGRLYNYQVTLTSAAREAVRDFAINQDHDQAVGVAYDAISSSMLPGPLVPDVPFSCEPGDPTTVRLEYPFTLRIPFIGDDLLTVTAEGVMRCGG